MTNTEKLTKEELESIKKLNTVQIIEQYPELVIKAVQYSTSKTQVLENLGLNTTNHRARINITKFAEDNGIKMPIYDRSSFTGRVGGYAPLTKEDVLSRLIKSDVNFGSSLRAWILRFNLIEYVCDTKDCIMKNLYGMGKH